jgi:hypothetical protein
MVPPPEDTAESDLLKRMQALYAQLRDEHRHSAKYKRLSEEIRKLAMAYRKIIDSQQDIDEPDPKP